MAGRREPKRGRNLRIVVRHGRRHRPTPATAVRLTHQDLKRRQIEEVPVSKLHRFLTLVYDLDNAAIVPVSNGSDQKALTVFLPPLKQPNVTIQQMRTNKAGDSIPAVINHLWPTQLVIKQMRHAMKLINDNLSHLRRKLDANSEICTKATYSTNRAVCSSRTITS